MAEKTRISWVQATLLLINMVTATLILVVPAITTEAARQDAWLSALVATFGGLLLAFIFTKLQQRFPRENLLQFSITILGPVLGKVVGFLYLWYFLHLAAIIIRSFGDFLVISFMPETPVWVFIIIITILAAYAVHNGLEVIARVNILFFALVILSIVIIFFLTAKDMDFTNLTPILAEGWKPVVRGSLFPLAWIGEIVIGLMILSHLANPGEIKRVYLVTTIGVGILLLQVIIGVVATFGPEYTSHLIFPGLTGTRIISIGNFIERLEALAMVMWVGGAFTKICLVYYAGVYGMAEWFRLKDPRPLVGPAGIILVFFALIIYEHFTDYLKFATVPFPMYTLTTFEGGLPLLLLVIAILRKKGGAGNVQKNPGSNDDSSASTNSRLLEPQGNK